MNSVDEQYLQLVNTILEKGNFRPDRTGTGTFSIFGSQMRFDLKEGFPLLTTKKLHVRSIFEELFWIISGSTNNNDLRERNVTIWDEWAKSDGELGPIYGKQWRNWGKGIDQLRILVTGLIENPYSRRHIITAWNPDEISDMALPPCHCFFQMYVNNKRELSCQLYQRSVDVGLGLPFNIASYALLTHMIAQVCNLEVGEFIHTGGDVHIYVNHIAPLLEQSKRIPLKLSKIQLNPNITALEHFTIEDIKLLDYSAHPSIKMDVSV